MLSRISMIALSHILDGRYILAVSGGVDSVVLLDILSQKQNIELIVAHFDHGIREDSADDAAFVTSLAERYGLQFELGQGHLGETASEATAREARYTFLREQVQKHHALAIVTAHHQDDMLETAIINLLRGTGRRGLASLLSNDEIVRPLLGVDKVELIAYAESKGLAWREDSTNGDTRYLRNKVRLELLPKASVEWRIAMLERIRFAADLNAKINHEVDTILSFRLRRGRHTLSRRWFISLSYGLSAEFIYSWLRKIGAQDIDQKTIDRLVVGAKTLRPGKRLDIDKRHLLLITKRSLRIVERSSGKPVLKT